MKKVEINSGKAFALSCKAKPNGNIVFFAKYGKCPKHRIENWSKDYCS